MNVTIILFKDIHIRLQITKNQDKLRRPLKVMSFIKLLSIDTLYINSISFIVDYTTHYIFRKLAF